MHFLSEGTYDTSIKKLCESGWSDHKRLLVMIMANKINKNQIRNCIENGLIPERNIEWIMRNLRIWPSKKVYTLMSKNLKNKVRKLNPLLALLYERDFMNLLS